MTQATHHAPYKMATISRLTDFSPAVLRAWERRHNLLEPRRGPGGHRLYSEEDLRILLRVKQLLASGRSIGEVASAGRNSLLDQATDADAKRVVRPGAQVRVPRVEGELQNRLERLTEEVVEAALRLDSDAIERTLDQAFARFATDTVVFEVIVRATRKIGELWIAGQCSVAHEHLASGVFVHRLIKLLESARPTHSPWRPVVVACFPDEFHQLGALVLAYMVSRNGVRVSYLGACMPFEDLEGGCEVLEPSALILSVTRGAVYQVHRQPLIDTLKRQRGKFPVFIGGSGAPGADSQVQAAGGRLSDPHEELDQSLKRLLDAIQKGRSALKGLHYS